ncbi:RdgB/HAM1 family non-canonical purine NTP pyrophosphatase [Pantoea sp. Aalb]|uniref:RdgB/HAM1 family non-canonical purine NTP pyrophosphatase n=1 Tax=Pantoea sp. Aalb TaxID=2576762 RepID=UPI001323C604|nr:RdgB/HAM1 family non-canonical purine NTP pyrophosphatase [Pantoea sp. Aalb]MXP67718.1 RdgB/HAM1 family non-canonical purine NTP pyrophosphatase [Pantoea sp. Aalb]
MHKVVIATNNRDKISQLTDILLNFHFEIVTQRELGIDSVKESGFTFIENAIIKSRYIAQITGLPTIADDSGLTVNALDHAPGIYSARYAGEFTSEQRNREKLLNEMKSVPHGKRQAQFHCVLVYMKHSKDPIPLISYGSWIGEITYKAIGIGGFGYDSIFYIPSLGKTAAELSDKERYFISHRGKALNQLINMLSNA